MNFSFFLSIHVNTIIDLYRLNALSRPKAILHYIIVPKFRLLSFFRQQETPTTALCDGSNWNTPGLVVCLWLVSFYVSVQITLSYYKCKSLFCWVFVCVVSAWLTLSVKLTKNKLLNGSWWNLVYRRGMSWFEW